MATTSKTLLVDNAPSKRTASAETNRQMNGGTNHE